MKETILPALIIAAGMVCSSPATTTRIDRHGCYLGNDRTLRHYLDMHPTLNCGCFDSTKRRHT